MTLQEIRECLEIKYEIKKLNHDYIKFKRKNDDKVFYMSVDSNFVYETEQKTKFPDRILSEDEITELEKYDDFEHWSEFRILKSGYIVFQDGDLTIDDYDAIVENAIVKSNRNGRVYTNNFCSLDHISHDTIESFIENNNYRSLCKHLNILPYIKDINKNSIYLSFLASNNRIDKKTDIDLGYKFNSILKDILKEVKKTNPDIRWVNMRISRPIKL